MDREAGENPLSNKQLQRSQVSKVKNHSRSQSLHRSPLKLAIAPNR